MFRFIFLVFSTLFGTYIHAQDSSSKKINIGVEQDLLPYATGGYFACVWAGRNHVRVRALTARVHKPDFIIQDGFTNNDVTAYAFTTDYFLKENWKGLWLAAGLVFWKSSIQAEGKPETVYFKNLLLNGSIGYNISLYKHFYVSPWCGLNILVAGDKNVNVGGQNFAPPLLNPEASVKFGIYF